MKSFEKIFNPNLVIYFRDYAINGLEESVPQLGFCDVKMFERLEIDGKRNKLGKEIYDEYIVWIIIAHKNFPDKLQIMHTNCSLSPKKQNRSHQTYWHLILMKCCKPWNEMHLKILSSVQNSPDFAGRTAWSWTSIWRRMTSACILSLVMGTLRGLWLS